MPGPKKKIEVEPEKKEEQIESLSLEMHSNSIEKEAQEKLSPELLRILKKIAYYTSKVGLTLKECCQLVDVDFETFKGYMKFQPVIAKVIAMKELEYKKDLMYTLTQKAKSGDDKIAQWLLECRYPLEFGSQKKKSGNDDSGDLFFQAVQFIRKGGDKFDLVNPESGRAIVVKQSHGAVAGGDLKVTEARIAHILGEK